LTVIKLLLHHSTLYTQKGIKRKSSAQEKKFKRRSKSETIESPFKPASMFSLSTNTDQTTQTALKRGSHHTGAQELQQPLTTVTTAGSLNGGGRELEQATSRHKNHQHQHVSFLNNEIDVVQGAAVVEETENTGQEEKEDQMELLKFRDKQSRRMSRREFDRYSTQLVRKPSAVLQVLDGKKKRSSGSNTDILRAREQMNQYQRIKNDRAISFMLSNAFYKSI
jgi:hypothetical protein